MGVTARISSCAKGVVATMYAVAATPTISQRKPIPTLMGGYSFGRLVRRVRTITQATIQQGNQVDDQAGCGERTHP